MTAKNAMIDKIMLRVPGFYFHVSFAAVKWLLILLAVIILAFIKTVDIRFNAGPVEYPMFIDGRKIIFLNYEPKSISEARAILARFDHRIEDGEKVVVND